MDHRDGSANVPAEVVKAEGRDRVVTGQRRYGCGRYEGQLGAGVRRVENVVLQKLKGCAVVLLSATLSDNIDRSGGGPPELGVVIGTLHRDFLNEFDAHFVEYAVVRSSIEVPTTVNAPVLAVQPLSVDDGNTVVVAACDGCGI